MKRLILLAVFICSFGVTARGQQILSGEADTLGVAEEVREDIFVALRGQVLSSDSLDVAMKQYIKKNRSRNVSVYRLRIFFDNKQTARNVSEQVSMAFSEAYPDIPVFRGYTNPYFKVTVGNFRTKSEAMKFLNMIKGQYPSVFLVKETFSTI